MWSLIAIVLAARHERKLEAGQKLGWSWVLERNAVLVLQTSSSLSSSWKGCLLFYLRTLIIVRHYSLFPWPLRPSYKCCQLTNEVHTDLPSKPAGFAWIRHDSLLHILCLKAIYCKRNCVAFGINMVKAVCCKSAFLVQQVFPVLAWWSNAIISLNQWNIGS